VCYREDHRSFSRNAAADWKHDTPHIFWPLATHVEFTITRHPELSSLVRLYLQPRLVYSIGNQATVGNFTIKIHARFKLIIHLQKIYQRMYIHLRSACIYDDSSYKIVHEAIQGYECDISLEMNDRIIIAPLGKGAISWWVYRCSAKDHDLNIMTNTKKRFCI